MQCVKLDLNETYSFEEALPTCVSLEPWFATLPLNKCNNINMSDIEPGIFVSSRPIDWIILGADAGNLVVLFILFGVIVTTKTT